MLDQIHHRILITKREKRNEEASKLIKKASTQGPKEQADATRSFHHADGLLSVMLVVGRDDCEGGSRVYAGTYSADELPHERKHHKGCRVSHEAQCTQAKDRNDLYILNLYGHLQ